MNHISSSNQLAAGYVDTYNGDYTIVDGSHNHSIITTNWPYQNQLINGPRPCVRDDPYYYPGLPYTSTNVDKSLDDLRNVLRELNDKPKEETPMKTLFNVVVVTTKEEILLDKKVVASDADEAKFLADVAGVLKEKKLLPKNVTVLCTTLGSVKVEKEPERVKLVKEE